MQWKDLIASLAEQSKRVTRYNCLAYSMVQDGQIFSARVKAKKFVTHKNSAVFLQKPVSTKWVKFELLPYTLFFAAAFCDKNLSQIYQKQIK